MKDKAVSNLCVGSWEGKRSSGHQYKTLDSGFASLTVTKYLLHSQEGTYTNIHPSAIHNSQVSKPPECP